MSELEELLLRELEELHRASVSTDWHDLLRVSAIVRKLLIDPNGLVDQVNRTYRQKIQFEIGTTSLDGPGPRPMLYLGLNDLDPEDGPVEFDGARKLVVRDEFFKRVVILTNGVEITVRDVIAYEAHVSGGVHVGTPKTEADVVLHALKDFVRVRGRQPTLESLRPIARVVARGLEPLRAAILRKPSWVLTVRRARQHAAHNLGPEETRELLSGPLQFEYWSEREKCTPEQMELIASALSSASRWEEATPWWSEATAAREREGGVRLCWAALDALALARCLLLIERPRDAAKSLKRAKAFQLEVGTSPYFNGPIASNYWRDCGRRLASLGNRVTAQWCNECADAAANLSVPLPPS